MDLEPHRTEETITLDKARQSIFQLAAPMAKINENIAIEVEAIRALTKLADTHQITAQELKEKLIETYMDLNPINLTHPRTIDYEEVKKQKTDPAVAKKLQENELKAESMQQEISKADARVKSLESEKKQIFDGLMIFTRFLLHNSIVQQNSVILDYIDMSIRNQERVAQWSKDDSIVKSLKQQRKDYVNQKEV
ncbi:hypothetical protein BGZ52_010849, partial [Haplosporangium bisporale]